MMPDGMVQLSYGRFMQVWKSQQQQKGILGSSEKLADKAVG